MSAGFTFYSFLVSLVGSWIDPPYFRLFFYQKTTVKIMERIILDYNFKQISTFGLPSIPVRPFQFLAVEWNAQLLKSNDKPSNIINTDRHSISFLPKAYFYSAFFLETSREPLTIGFIFFWFHRDCISYPTNAKTASRFDTISCWGNQKICCNKPNITVSYPEGA